MTNKKKRELRFAEKERKAEEARKRKEEQNHWAEVEQERNDLIQSIQNFETEVAAFEADLELNPPQEQSFIRGWLRGQKARDLLHNPLTNYQEDLLEEQARYVPYGPEHRKRVECNFGRKIGA